MRKITIIIDKEGQTQVEANGYQGGSCVKATTPLTKTLIGGAPTESVKKPEFYLGDHVALVRETE
jgi:hypothetical protein